MRIIDYNTQRGTYTVDLLVIDSPKAFDKV